MIAGRLSDLAQSIRDSALPRWLHEYLAEHRDRIGAELKLFGQHEIPMPDGGTITIRVKDFEPERDKP